MMAVELAFGLQCGVIPLTQDLVAADGDGVREIEGSRFIDHRDTDAAVGVSHENVLGDTARFLAEDDVRAVGIADFAVLVTRLGGKEEVLAALGLGKEVVDRIIVGDVDEVPVVEPRSFEVVGLYGIGWGHLFGDPKSVMVPVDDIYYVKAPEYNQIVNRNNMTSKAAVDFVFNLGDEKAWQFYVEPSVTWGLNDVIVSSRKGTDLAVLGHQGLEYNINKMYVQLNAGFIYKFQNSNGTHNFTVARLRDQAEIDGLNAEINRLRDELAKKPREIVKEVEVVKEVAGKNIVREVKVEDLVFVTFAQGKSELTADARKALSSIQAGKHVQIVGTASPEGNPELNQRLSQARADAVAQYLLTRGVAVDEATGKGVQGTTSNRLAVVYVK